MKTSWPAHVEVAVGSPAIAAVAATKMCAKWLASEARLPPRTLNGKIGPAVRTTATQPSTTCLLRVRRLSTAHSYGRTRRPRPFCSWRVSVATRLLSALELSIGRGKQTNKQSRGRTVHHNDQHRQHHGHQHPSLLDRHDGAKAMFSWITGPRITNVIEGLQAGEQCGSPRCCAQP